MELADATINFLQEACKILPANKLYTTMRSQIMSKLTLYTQYRTTKELHCCKVCGVDFGAMLPYQRVEPAKSPNRFLRRCLKKDVYNTKFQALAVQNYRSRWYKKQKIVLVCKLCEKREKKLVTKPDGILTSKKPRPVATEQSKKKKKKAKIRNLYAGLNPAVVNAVAQTTKKPDVGVLYEGFVPFSTQNLPKDNSNLKPNILQEEGFIPFSTQSLPLNLNRKTQEEGFISFSTQNFPKDKPSNLKRKISQEEASGPSAKKVNVSSPEVIVINDSPKLRTSPNRRIALKLTGINTNKTAQETSNNSRKMASSSEVIVINDSPKALPKLRANPIKKLPLKPKDTNSSNKSKLTPTNNKTVKETSKNSKKNLKHKEKQRKSLSSLLSTTNSINPTSNLESFLKSIQ